MDVTLPWSRGFAFALRTFHTSGEWYHSLTVLFGLLQCLPDVVLSALLMVGCEHKDAR